jgi:chemotaxis protein MotB
MARPGNGTVIIKKIKKGGHGGHHGGSWKVAYADFVTAMMAFFLLLWLLNVTTDVQKRGIADYFEPTIAITSKFSGSGGILGGTAVGKPGSMKQDQTAPSVETEIPPDPQSEDADEADDEGDPKRVESPGEPVRNNTASVGTLAKAGASDTGDRGKIGEADKGDQGKLGEADKGDRKLGDADKGDRKLGEAEKGDKQQFNSELDQITAAALTKNAAQREERQFAAAEFALRQAIQDVPDLKSLAENLIIDRTPEGLRVQLVDQDKSSMFPSGSADMGEPARKLMALVSQVVQRLPNKVALSGHTDATPFAKTSSYGNWELSTDRANASRRQLLAAGLPADRIAQVVGVADKDPLVTDDPTSPRNRRISIVLLKEAKPVTSLAQAK